MLQNDGAIRVDDKADVEEAIGPVFVTRLGLRHDENAPLARQLSEAVGFRARNVDRASPCKFGVIDVENFVVEPLQRTLGNGD